MINTRIRAVLESELNLLRDISIQTFVDAFGSQNTASDMKLYIEESRNQLVVRQEFDDPNVILLFTESEGSIAGFMKINLKDAQSEQFELSSLELERIYVLPDFQGKGVGEQMLAFFEKTGREQGVDMIWLGVWKKNPRAISFYERHGFEIFGEHDYLLGTDLQRDFLMRKIL